MNFGYGFISHFWYNALDRMVTATGVSRVVKKMLIDQFLSDSLLLWKLDYGGDDCIAG